MAGLAGSAKIWNCGKMTFAAKMWWQWSKKTYCPARRMGWCTTRSLQVGAAAQFVASWMNGLSATTQVINLVFVSSAVLFLCSRSFVG